MHFVLILAVLIATTLAEKAPAEAVEAPGWGMLLTMVAMLLAPALAASISAVVVRGIKHDIYNWAAWVARFSWAQQVHAAVWVVLVAAISYGLAWPQIVRQNWGLATWILVDELLILAPVYVPLLLSWAMFYDVDRTVGELTADEHDAPHPPGRWHYVLLHARHYLALVLAPLLLVLGLYDVARWFAPEFADGPFAWLLIAPVLPLLVLFLPQLLAALWRTEPMPPGRLRSVLEEVLASAGLKVRDILVWRTDGRVTNAAVSGLSPRLRYVFLTDRLLETLTPEEVIAVLRHEAGHVVRRHLLLRMLLLGLPLVVWLAIAQAIPESIESITSQLAQIGISPYLQQCVLLPGAIALFGLYALGGYCQLLEYEADLFACQSVGPDAPVIETSAFITSLRRITEESGGDPSRGGWLHPSLAHRIRFLERVQGDPSLANRFRRSLKQIAWAMGVGYLFSLTIIALSL